MRKIGVHHQDQVPKNFTGIAEWYDGTKVWYRDGNWHRSGAPAIENKNGEEHWYQNGIKHRLDGPASIWRNGTKEWYKKGKLHRLDGPAIEWASGHKQYYIWGHLLRKEQFEMFQFLWKNTFLKQTDELIGTFVQLVTTK